ncbi:MAG: GIY-YIG nuclease family protein [Elusimicrobia bacterium]|nr:GIY-YIG nuclease family protein [Elusimicrobiota bacterium]
MTDKKALKNEYKMTPLQMGIYKITNLENGKIFIGKGLDLRGKINGARFQLDMGSHMNRMLQKEYAEYGKENFSFEILDRLKPGKDPARDYSEELGLLLEMWLDRLRPFGDKGYHKKTG